MRFQGYNHNMADKVEVSLRSANNVYVSNNNYLITELSGYNFLIDRATGRTWQMVGMHDGQPEWVEVQGNPIPMR